MSASSPCKTRIETRTNKIVKVEKENRDRTNERESERKILSTFLEVLLLGTSLSLLSLPGTSHVQNFQSLDGSVLFKGSYTCWFSRTQLFIMSLPKGPELPSLQVSSAHLSVAHTIPHPQPLIKIDL